MSRTKRIVIVALVCVNVALVAAVALVASAPPANAQVIGAGVDYLVVTGRLSENQAAVYIVDLAKQSMAAFDFDKTAKKLRAIDGRSLQNDFRVRGRRGAP